MKRWHLSVIGGFLIAFCYGFISGRLAPFVNGDAYAILRLPIAWPSYIYYHFYPLDPHRELIILDGFENGNILSVIFGNVAVYSLLTYAFLSWRAGRAKRLP